LLKCPPIRGLRIKIIFKLKKVVRIFGNVVSLILLCIVNLNYSLNTYNMEQKAFNPKAQQPIVLSADELKRFNEIYNKHFNEILNYIKFKIKSVEDAEEIAIDTFEKVCRYMNTFDESKSKFSTWLRNVANTCISDHFRVDHTDNEISVSDFADAESGRELFSFVADEDSDKLVESHDFQKKIAKVFGKLKPKYRRVATLYFLREKEYNEIAEICEIPMGSVKGMISRCREMLKAELQREKLEYAI